MKKLVRYLDDLLLSIGCACFTGAAWLRWDAVGALVAAGASCVLFAVLIARGIGGRK